MAEVACTCLAGTVSSECSLHGFKARRFRARVLEVARNEPIDEGRAARMRRRVEELVCQRR